MRHIHNLAVTTTSKSDDSDVTPVTLNPSDDEETVLFVCGECHVTFSSSEELERHANEEHQVDAKEETFKDEEDHKAAAVEVRIVPDISNGEELYRFLLTSLINQIAF